MVSLQFLSTSSNLKTFCSTFTPRSSRFSPNRQKITPLHSSFVFCKNQSIPSCSSSSVLFATSGSQSSLGVDAETGEWAMQGVHEANPVLMRLLKPNAILPSKDQSGKDDQFMLPHKSK